LSVTPTNVAPVRLRFETGDDDAYLECRDALLDELHAWLETSESERDEVVADVAFFLDWRYRESTGVLDEFTPGELAEFLVDWCPRRLTGRTDAAVGLCYAVGVYVDFMAATERLVGGVERAARLRKMVDDLAPTVLAETRDRTPAGGPSGEEPELFELPFACVPPPLQDVEAAAAAAPLLAKVAALRGYLGPDGKRLTDKGNLQVADGRALVELLDTGDETLKLTTTASLRCLNFILDGAIGAGAVRVHQRRVFPVQEWGARPAIARAEALFAAIVDVGPLSSQCPGPLLHSDEPLQLFDAGIVHWLVPLLAPDAAEQPFESLVEWAELTVSPQLERYRPDEADAVEAFTEEGVARILQTLEDAGVVRWTDRVESPQPFGPSYWTGGTVSLTALGRHLLPDYLERAGYALRRDPVAEGDGAELIDAMLSAADTQHESLVAGWQADLPVVERVHMLTGAIAEASSAASRMMGFVALDMFDIEVAEPVVRQLLDTPAAGHAALWLIARDPADAAVLGSFVDIGVLIDVLSRDVDDPDELCGLFTAAPEPLQLLENMWRHPAPETALVLDALGRHLPDRTLAKAARKAAVRHRSWIANRP
jgi:hypothetical protein